MANLMHIPAATMWYDDDELEPAPTSFSVGYSEDSDGFLRIIITQYNIVNEIPISKAESRLEFDAIVELHNQLGAQIEVMKKGYKREDFS